MVWCVYWLVHLWLVSPSIIAEATLSHVVGYACRCRQSPILKQSRLELFALSRVLQNYMSWIFTRGQFWPSGIVVAWRLCVHPSVCVVITVGVWYWIKEITGHEDYKNQSCLGPKWSRKQSVECTTRYEMMCINSGSRASWRLWIWVWMN